MALWRFPKADFEQQIATIYHFDQDQVWKEAHRLADEAVTQAKSAIAAQCEKLGIPPQFAPDLSFGWYGRGENGSKDRRTELRRVAYACIDALVKDAKTRIGVAASEVRVRLVSGSLESDEAKAFLASMPTAADMMPKFTLKEIQDDAAKDRSSRWMLEP